MLGLIAWYVAEATFNRRMFMTLPKETVEARAERTVNN